MGGIIQLPFDIRETAKEWLNGVFGVLESRRERLWFYWLRVGRLTLKTNTLALESRGNTGVSNLRASRSRSGPSILTTF